MTKIYQFVASVIMRIFSNRFLINVKHIAETLSESTKRLSFVNVQITNT